jgi:hypothetical protein
MAVPVVTLRALGAEATHTQNVGDSLLTQVGCTELIANSEDEFLEITVNLARSPERLRMLRETLRQRLLASPLCNDTRYMHHVENQYRCIWRRFCDVERAKSEQRGDMEGSGSGVVGGTQAPSLSLHQSEQAQDEGGGERGLDEQEQEREKDEEVVRMDRKGGEGSVPLSPNCAGEGSSPVDGEREISSTRTAFPHATKGQHRPAKWRRD